MPAALMVFALTFVLSIFDSSLAFAADVSCACEQVACKPCETETNLTFYTAKCGPSNSRVKSCKRPTCEPVPNQKQCLVDLQSEDPAVKLAALQAAKKPEVASSTTKTEVAAVSIGKIANMFGRVKLSRSTGVEALAEIHAEIFEGDQFETEKDGKVRVAMNDGNILNISPDTKVVVDRYAQVGGKRKTLLNLMYGKMRSQVNKNNRYDDRTSYFRVKTKSAVAGVRGTDFVTIFIAGEKNWITKIQTLEGRVKFGGESPNEDQESRANDMEGYEEVGAGQFAVFSMPTPKGNDFTDMQLKSYILKGELSKPALMTPPETEEVDRTTDFKNLTAAEKKIIERQLASVVKPALCGAPQGEFGTCSYTCEGVNCGECLRRSCDAGGVWGLPTRIDRGYCEMGKVMVRKQCFN